jgi:hypothetical protein
MPNIRLHQSARPSRTELAELRDFFWSAPDAAPLDRRVVAAGLNRSVSWLEGFATRGGGPAFLKIGQRVLYRKGDVVTWFNSRVQRCTSTSALRQEDEK